MDEPRIAVRGLRRVFEVRPRRRGLRGALTDLVAPRTREVVALDHVDLSVHAGEIVGYIGPNGAGKSTTVKCLTGILKPTSGTVRVNGLDPWAQRARHVRQLGVVFGQRTQLWWDLAVIEAFDLLAAVFEVPRDVYGARLEELCATLDLDPLLRVPVRELSLGQRVRCDLAASLLHAPSVVLLDEPTIGLDVAVKHRIRAFVRDVADARGAAVLLTTHDLGDVEQLCDRVVLVDSGRVVFEGDVRALRARLGGRRRLVVHAGHPLSDADLARVADGLPATAAREGDGGLALSFGVDQPAGPLVRAVLDRLGAIEDLAVVEPSIEEVVAAFYDERAR